VTDPVLRKVEHDGFERRLVHARTLPTLFSGSSEVRMLKRGRRLK